ncbi:hypothetical protein TMRO357_02640 [Alteriqipengyuania sp. 357]
MTKHRDIAIPASATTLFNAPLSAATAAARLPYYLYYFGSFSGRYA